LLACTPQIRILPSSVGNKNDLHFTPLIALEFYHCKTEGKNDASKELRKVSATKVAVENLFS